MILPSGDQAMDQQLCKAANWRTSEPSRLATKAPLVLVKAILVPSGEKAAALERMSPTRRGAPPTKGTDHRARSGLREVKGAYSISDLSGATSKIFVFRGEPKGMLSPP